MSKIISESNRWCWKKLIRLLETGWDSVGHFHWVVQEGFSEEVTFEVNLNYMKQPVMWSSGDRAVEAEEAANEATWRRVGEQEGVKEQQVSVAGAERPQEAGAGWVPETGKASRPGSSHQDKRRPHCSLLSRPLTKREQMVFMPGNIRQATFPTTMRFFSKPQTQ